MNKRPPQSEKPLGRSTASYFCLLLTSFIFIAPLKILTANPLVDYQWKNRLVLVSIPESEMRDSFRKQIEKVLNEKRSGLADRDLVVIDVSGAGRQMGGAIRFAESESKALRRRLSIGDGSAEFLLLGKDGKVKARQTDKLNLEQFFALIETMPMRKEEMRRRNRD